LTGGAEKQSIILAYALKYDFKTSLLVYYGDQVDDCLISLAGRFEVEVILLKGSHLSKILNIYKLFKSEKPIALISFLLTSNFITAIIGTICGVKNKIGGVSSDRVEGWKLVVEKILHRYFLSKSVFNNYSGYKTLISKGFIREKCHVIYNGIEIMLSEFPKNRTENDVFNILTVSRFVLEKDYDTLLGSIWAVIQQLNHELIQKKIFLTIVGYGELEQYVRLKITELELDEYVELVIKPKNVNYYFEKAHLYLSTSIQEGTSNSILEAMSFRLPVVATMIGDNDKIIIHGKNGFLCKVKDVREISKFILKLVDEIGLAKQMGIHGFFILKRDYSINNLKLKFSSIIDIT